MFSSEDKKEGEPSGPLVQRGGHLVFARSMQEPMIFVMVPMVSLVGMGGIVEP